MTGLQYDRMWFCIERTDNQELKETPGKLWQGVSKCKELGRVFTDIIDGTLIFSHPEMDHNLEIQIDNDITNNEIIEFLNYDKIILK